MEDSRPIFFWKRFFYNKNALYSLVNDYIKFRTFPRTRISGPIVSVHACGVA